MFLAAYFNVQQVEGEVCFWLKKKIFIPKFPQTFIKEHISSKTLQSVSLKLSSGMGLLQERGRI